MTVRIALVGCGQISRAHIGAIQGIEGLEICGVCDRDRDNARKAADLAGGAQMYSDVGDLLREERPDAVHILTPPATHSDLAIQAMEAGCHVLVEKPMAVSLQQADSMIAASRDNQVKLCTNHNYLFKPSVVRARQLVEGGAIGEVVHVHSYYGLSGEARAYTDTAGRAHWAQRLPGGAFTNFSPHLIYLQLAFLQEVDSVAGVTLVHGNGASKPATEMDVLLQGSSASGVMSISIRAKPYAKFVDIYGTKGIVHADLVREVCTIHKNRSVPRMVSKVLYSLEDSVQLASGTAANTVKVALGRMKNMPGLQVLVREFYASIEDGRDPPVPGEEGRKMLEVLETVWDRSQAVSSPIVATASPSAPTGPKNEAERAVTKAGLPGKVLVTGATGYLGHRLVAALSRCGADVVALVREENRASPDLERQATLVRGDIRDPASVEAAMQDVAVVYHCAAVTRNAVPWTAHHETNILGTKVVLEEALKAQVQRVIHVSSVIVYGLKKPRNSQPVQESAPYAQNPNRWAYYMRSKIEADKLALSYWHESGLPVTVVRPGILYGPGGKTIGGGASHLGPVRLFIGNGRNRLPYVYVDNAIELLLLAAISLEAVGQVYNAVDEPQVRVHDVAVQRREMTGEQTRLVPVPSFLFSSMARFVELRASLSDSETPPKLSRFVVRSACRDLVYDTRNAREQLGWEPEVSLEEGLHRALNDIS